MSLRRRLLPPFFYWAAFYLFSPHLAGHFSDRFFADGGDGLNNVWNLWWVHRAVAELGQNPWFTDYLHYPVGTTLIGQTMSPFNGLLGVPLHGFLSLVQIHNLIVVFSFVVAGWTTYLLCLEVTGDRWASWLGGAVFTFSNYHFTHAEGHLNLVSLEWIPLFILLWYRFLVEPGVLRGLSSGVVLFLVILCDYYYFIYCVLAGLVMALWLGRKSGDVLYLLRRRYLPGTLTFLAFTVCTSGVISGALLVANWKDPFIGAHLSDEFSMDLLAPFVPGFHWRFSALTRPIWQRFTGNGNETSVFVGWSVLLLAWFAWKNRKRLASRPAPDLALWGTLGVLFLALSLGTGIHFLGHSLFVSLLPYTVLGWIFPPLSLSGVPVRMMVMTQLMLAIFAAAGLTLLKGRKGKLWTAAFLGLFILEYYPAPIPLTDPSVPPFVYALKQLPGDGVLDLDSSNAQTLYYQTIHGKRMAFGYLARIPTSVAVRDTELLALIDRKDWRAVFCEAHIQYLLSREDLSGDSILQSANKTITTDSVRIYSRKPLQGCAN